MDTARTVHEDSEVGEEIENISNIIKTEETRKKTVCERCPPHNHVSWGKRKATRAEALKLWELFLEKKKRIHPTLVSQFHAFATMMDSRRDGRSINLFRSDYWLKQAKILDDTTITMIDTSNAFNKFVVIEPSLPKEKKKLKNSTAEEPIPTNELTYEQWLEHVKEICKLKELDEELIKEMLRKCGLPHGEPWQDTPKRDVKRVRSSMISLDPVKCKCICERYSVEFDPYIHLPPPESIFIIQD